ncbi:BTAD domain-containing putative transcriptional regulator [Actinoplanes oryzae]
MRIQVLGPVRVWAGDGPVDLTSPGQRAVLGLLALATGQPVTQPELIDSLWGDRPPPTAANVLQTHVKRLRRLLEPDRPPRSRSAVLPHIGDGYALRPGADGLDLLRFRRLLAEAAEAQHRGDGPAAAARYAEALAEWTGAPLLDVPVLAQHPKVLALREEHRTALGRYGELLIALGQAREALPALQEAANDQPLDEAGQARLIRALGAAGRRAEAFAAFHDARRRLAGELGVDPGPELVAAHETVLREGGPAAPSRVREIPAQLPADVPAFTGREEELAVLDKLLQAGSPVAVVAGTAGVGKTALAVHWAHRVRGGFPDGQLYVNLRGYDVERPMPPGEGLARFLRALGLPGADVPGDLDERAARYRSLLDGRRMLLVLDNAASVDQVRPLLPGSPSCVVLVTSRDTLPGLVAREGARRLDLRLMPADDALSLVRRLVGDRVNTGPAAAADLVDRCARLPLALRVAAELAVARPEVSLAALVAELADEERRLDLLAAGGDPRTGVRAVFSWSYQQLTPAAARAFRLVGLHPGADFDEHAAAALLGTGVTEARRLLTTLSRAHLVQQTAPDRYLQHDLLRAYARELAAGRDAADGRDALDRLADAWLFTAGAATDVLHPAERHRRDALARPATALPLIGSAEAALSWLDAERANLVALVAHSATARPRHAVRLTITLLRYLESAGHHAEATTMHAYARKAAQQLGDPAAEAHLLTNMAVAEVQQGHYEPAAGLLRRAVELARACGDSAVEARALGNLGHIDQGQGRYADAARRLEEALALCRQAGDSAGEARALGNLGQVRLRQGRHDEAARRLRAAIDLCRRIGDGPGEGYALISLGHVARARGSDEEAARCHREALGIFRRTSERAGEALALDGIGSVTRNAGCLREAIAVLHGIGERSGEARATNSLGEVLTATDRPVEARNRHTAALALAVATGDRYEQARAHAGLAAAARALAEPAAAGTHTRAADHLWTTLGISR